ncbi:hypothetical protein [Lysinibacillus sphaericus]|nr:hypothetical protein [Lysinibacillus sphaericus]
MEECITEFKELQSATKRLGTTTRKSANDVAYALSELERARNVK